MYKESQRFEYIECICDVKRLLALFFEWLEQNSQPSVVPCSLEARNLTVCLLHRSGPQTSLFQLDTSGRQIHNPFTAIQAAPTVVSAVPGVGNALATHGPEPSHSCRDHSRRHEGQFIKGHHESALDCASVVRRRTHTVPHVVHDATARVRKPLQM